TCITIPDNVTEIGNNPFLSCSNLMEFSGRYAEDGGRILVIDGVLKAFAPAGLNQYTIPDSVTTIGYAAFRDCDSLTSLTIPDSVIEIEANSFNGCSNLMEFRGNYAEDGGRILVVDGTLVAFAPAGITEYTIPDSVTTIGERAFYNCDSLTSITISDNVTTIGIYAFDGCNNLASITMGNGVKTIGGCAFWTCTSLTSVIIPDSVKEVNINAFLDCTNLISVTIGKGVETIRDTAFYNCENLTDVYSEAIIPPVLGDRVFSCYDYDEKNYKPINGNIYVPAESVDAYKAADGWSEYADAIVAYDFEKGEVVE
ncbi:MAG: leucine-rich repeat domain-containing protein, partial [Alistipes sp.]|nr:leucine-rich repeat domain-containing protein [Alistipes sp.]